jgi:hypothetical protein
MIILVYCMLAKADPQDRQLAKNIYFLAINFGESSQFSRDQSSQVVTCRQLGRPSRQLIL